MKFTRLTAPIIGALIDLFYARPAELGQVEEVDGGALPPDYQTLLAHQSHMTVAVEKYYGCEVGVRVLAKSLTGEHYARKILLYRKTDQAIVQFGIMRLDFKYVSPEVRRAVESETTPLGRILIEHEVLREIHLVRLWRVTPGSDLQNLLGIGGDEITYGRTAIIDCNGEPAVELLEIVRPV